MMKPTRTIGLLGCSHIAPVSVLQPAKEIAHLHVAGVAGRDLSRARDYAAKHGISRVYGSYEELLHDPEIDLVYIPLANHLHKEWAIRSAVAGKHMLVEKPLCLTVDELHDIQRACRDHRVVCHEAIMVQHHPWQAALKELVDTGAYGRLVKTHTHISHPMRHADNYRFYTAFGGGVFRDEGPYWLQFVQSLAGLQPLALEGRSAFAGPNGSDWTFHASLQLPGGVEATFYASFDEAYQATHWIELERAKVRVKDFFRARLGAFKISIDIFGLNDERLGSIVLPPQNYYVNQLQHVLDVIDGVQPPAPDHQVLERIRLLDAIYHSATAKGGL